MLIKLIFLVVGVTGCIASNDDESSSRHGTLIDTVNYQTAWTDDVRTTAWSMKSNLGYQVTVESAFLVHYSLQLIPCERDTGLSWASSFISQAVAGHSGEEDDSVTRVPVVEALHEQRTIDIGTVSFSPTRYCKVHYLVGRADDSTESLPIAPDMMGSSLFVEGTWTHPSSGENGYILLSTELAHGVILDLSPGNGSGEFTLTLARDSSLLFDDVDFRTQNESQQTWQILINAVVAMTAVLSR